MTNQLPTSKQLERTLSQSIRAFYQEHINHTPQKVTCKLFSRYLAIIADEALTPLETSLWKLGKRDLSQQVRTEINRILQTKLTQLIEETISVKIEEILGNVAFDLNKSGILVILSEPPKVRGTKADR